MKSWNFWIAGFVGSSLAFAQTEISVRVCNAVQVAAGTLERGEKEASFVLQTGGVVVTWMDCSTEIMERPLGPRDFVLTVTGHRPAQGGSARKDVMGATWLVDGTKQTALSVYYDAVREFAASRFAEAQIDQILGCAIAHEFGHLFLGPAHTAGGVMQAEWRKHELVLMGKHEIRFTSAERARIQDELASTTRVSQAVALENGK